MRPIADVEFPEDVERTYREARLIQWITVAYIISASAFLYITMGSSQAMRTSFFDDAVSIVPAVAFLVASAVARRAPRPDFPYGTHRATSIAYLTAALSLCGMGLYLLFEAGAKVLASEKTTIGGVSFFGNVVWAGWPMLAAIAYSAIPAFILGRMKLRLAPKIHDKVLFADAQMMRADWLAEIATAAGVIGAGFGLWWLDPLAAALVAADILKDGAANLKTAVLDLLGRHPMKTDQSGREPLPEQVRDLLLGMGWVAGAEVRLREEGHIFMGEAFVVPHPGTDDITRRVGEAAEAAKRLNWRMHELTVMPVERLPEPPLD